MEDLYLANNSKNGSACCAVRFMYHFHNINTPKMIYFACVLSIMKYGIIFRGNSMDGKRVFQLQKKVVRIMRGKIRNVISIFTQNIGNTDSAFSV
jgi:hypothetical protein